MKRGRAGGYHGRGIGSTCGQRVGNHRSGRHFLQIPGPTNVPGRVLEAIGRPTIDHRGPEFAALGRACLDGMRRIFRTTGRVYVFPSSGTGAWEAALVNTLSPGDRVLVYETGHFARLWAEVARRLGLAVEVVEGDWRSGVDAGALGDVLARDADGGARGGRVIRAVAVLHNETSTGAASDVAAVRRALDACGHPALLLVDTISSLASMPYAHDAWGVDVTVAGSQKGLMLPPGLGFNAVSERAHRASRETAKLARSYWDWGAMDEPNAAGWFPFTPATNLLFGLEEAIAMLEEEGLERVFARHRRLAEAVRRAVQAWGLEFNCRPPAHRSASLTAVRTPDGTSADALRALVLDRFDVSLGNGLGRLHDRVFRIGHLGDLNDVTLLGALAAVEMGLSLAGAPFQRGGVDAAMDHLAVPIPAPAPPAPSTATGDGSASAAIPGARRRRNRQDGVSTA